MYISIEETLFQEQTDEYICKVTRTVEEAKDYIEQGFTYVCDIDGSKMFRKPK
jgi:hypothetical protein